jgi:hypothetical protein
MSARIHPATFLLYSHTGENIFSIPSATITYQFSVPKVFGFAPYKLEAPTFFEPVVAASFPSFSEEGSVRGRRAKRPHRDLAPKFF